MFKDGFSVFFVLFYSFMRMYSNIICIILNKKISIGSYAKSLKRLLHVLVQSPKVEAG